MANQFKHEEVAAVPKGHQVRTVKSGAHQVRIAFPPGPPKKGSGQLVSILHPNPDPGCTRRKLNGVLEAVLAGAAAGGTAAVVGKKLNGARPADLGRQVRLALGHRVVHAEVMQVLPDGGAELAFPNSFGEEEKVTLSPEAWDQRVRPVGSNGKKKNQPTAAQAFTEFHGRAPREVLELQEALVDAGDYFALGDMGGLWLQPVPAGKDPTSWPLPSIEFDASDHVKLATDDGQQLYLIGGNQELPVDYLKRFGRDVDHRFVSLGECHAISYETEKSFDGFQTTEYAHEFGEQTGERPSAWYDRETRRILLVGGAYTIAPLDEGLGASPGIVN